jgi:hypothetical protein
VVIDHEFEGRMRLLGSLISRRRSEASHLRNIVFIVLGMAIKFEEV